MLKIFTQIVALVLGGLKIVVVSGQIYSIEKSLYLQKYFSHLKRL